MLHVLRVTGVPRPQWASAIGVPPFVVDKLIAQARNFTPTALAAATQELAIVDRALKGDLTLRSLPEASSPLPSGGRSRWTGPQIKALGRELAERVMLEQVVDGIVRRAVSPR